MCGAGRRDGSSAAQRETLCASATTPARHAHTFQHQAAFRDPPSHRTSAHTHPHPHTDGDGMVLSVAFKDGKAYFRNRFVKTKGFLDEQAAGRPLYRTTFSSGSPDGSKLFNPFDLTFKVWTWCTSKCGGGGVGVKGRRCGLGTVGTRCCAWQIRMGCRQTRFDDGPAAVQ
eukprot:363284-Chlamydomonas_euryale.AAC.2